MNLDQKTLGPLFPICRQFFDELRQSGAASIDRRVPGMPDLRVRIKPNGGCRFSVRRRVRVLAGQTSRPRIKIQANSYVELVAGYDKIISVHAEGRDPRGQSMTVDQFVDLIEPVCSGKRKSDNRQRYDKWLSCRIGNIPIGSLRRADLVNALAGIKAEGKLKPGTINRYRATCMWLGREAEMRELVDRNPASRLPLEKENPRARILSRDELNRLLTVMGGETDEIAVLFVAFLMVTGVRLGTALTLRWNAVDVRSRSMLLTRQKNDKDVHLPLSEAAVAIVQELELRRRNDFLFPSSDGAGHINAPRGFFKRVCLKADISDLTFHDLRRSFCAFGVRAQVGIELMSKLLTHSSIAVTARHYAVIGQSCLFEAIDHVGDALSDQIDFDEPSVSEWSA